MNETDSEKTNPNATDYRSDFSVTYALSRRTFLQVLGSGILISVVPPGARGQGQGNSVPVSTRILLNKDGSITDQLGDDWGPKWQAQLNRHLGKA